MFFNQPCPAGEHRYAVAIEDGADLRLALVVRRSRKGEYFVLMPRDGDWNLHASYHIDGRYHHKSYDQASLMPQLRQRFDQFKGTEHPRHVHGVWNRRGTDLQSRKLHRGA